AGIARHAASDTRDGEKNTRINTLTPRPRPLALASSRTVDSAPTLISRHRHAGPDLRFVCHGEHLFAEEPLRGRQCEVQAHEPSGLRESALRSVRQKSRPELVDRETRES